MLRYKDKIEQRAEQLNMIVESLRARYTTLSKAEILQYVNELKINIEYLLNLIDLEE